jgi:hypothetical protein
VVNPRNNGRKTDLLALITAEKEKKDWAGERIGFELVVAFRRKIAIYWPTKSYFACLRETESPNRIIGRTARCRIVSAKPPVNSLS